MGEWNKEEDGAWNFHPDPMDFGFEALIRDNETFWVFDEHSEDEICGGRTDTNSAILPVFIVDGEWTKQMY